MENPRCVRLGRVLGDAGIRECMCVFVPQREIKTVSEKRVGVFEMCVRECLRAVCVKMKQSWCWVRCAYTKVRVLQYVQLV